MHDGADLEDWALGSFGLYHVLDEDLVTILQQKEVIVPKLKQAIDKAGSNNTTDNRIINTYAKAGLKLLQAYDEGEFIATTEAAGQWASSFSQFVGYEGK